MPEGVSSLFRALRLLALIGMFLVGESVPPVRAAALRLTGKSDLPAIEQVTNPHPEPGDIALPMPGGLSMILRAVCVPAGGYLDDQQHPFGVASSDQDGRTSFSAWTDRRYTASVNAPFELSDIPQSWGSALHNWLAADPATGATARNGLRTFLYFIGKYEVTQAQWRAVMADDTGDGIHFAMQPGDDKPVTNISWFESMEFSRRYSEWLMQNHPEYLPYFAQENRSSFIRLPTEAEWEYAARGGHRATAVDRERTRLHPAPDNADMSEYIIASQYDAKLAGLASIGSRKSNPAGLHDILGNAAEMVETPFQLVSAGHLMGSHGGFIIKGGSWRAFSVESLHPGRRIEAAYYVNGSSQRRDDLGFRVSLGTILTPRDRQTALQQEWERRSAPRTGEDSADQDVRVIIREVVREVESPELRQKLAEAEQVASLYHEQVNINEERMTREMLLGAAFSLETIANYASRCYQLIRLMDAYETLSPQEKDNRQPQIAKMKREIDGFIKGIRAALFYYRNMLDSSEKMKVPMLLAQLEALEIQFSHPDGFSRSMTRRIGVIRKHLSDAHARKARRTDLEDLSDMLPAWLTERLKVYL